MRIDIVNKNCITLFINLEELTSRGFSEGDHHKNVEMFNELVEEVLCLAEFTHEFDLLKPIHTEASFIPEEGAFIKITNLTNSQDASQQQSARSELCYLFHSFEDVINCAAKTPEHLRDAGTLYLQNGKYVLSLCGENFSDEQNLEDLQAVISEYATLCNTTLAVLQEYSKEIVPKNALRVIHHYFLNPQ